MHTISHTLLQVKEASIYICFMFYEDFSGHEVVPSFYNDAIILSTLFYFINQHPYTSNIDYADHV